MEIRWFKLGDSTSTFETQSVPRGILFSAAGRPPAPNFAARLTSPKTFLKKSPKLLPFLKKVNRNILYKNTVFRFATGIRDLGVPLYTK